jgi:hypothetical protein
VGENFRESRLDPPGPGILAVSQCRADIRPRNGGKNLGRDPGRVVTCEIHAASLCACFAQGAARCLAAGRPGGLIMLTHRASEKRSTSATIADGARGSAGRIRYQGRVPCKFVPLAF